MDVGVGGPLPPLLLEEVAGLGGKAGLDTILPLDVPPILPWVLLWLLLSLINWDTPLLLLLTELLL